MRRDGFGGMFEGASSMYPAYMSAMGAGYPSLAIDPFVGQVMPKTQMGRGWSERELIDTAAHYRHGE